MRLSELQGQNKTIRLSELQSQKPADVQSDAPIQESPIGWKEAAISGPIARGVEAVQKGLSIGDAPNIASEILSGALYGAPKFIAERPIAGLVQAFDTSNSVFPKSVTPEGEKLGNELGMAAGFMPAIEVLQNIISPVAKVGAKGVSNRLMNSVLKPTIRDLQQNPELGYEAAKIGLTGTKKQIFEKAQNLIDANEEKLQTILDNSSGKVDAYKVSGVLDELKRPFVNTGDQVSVDAIENIQNTLKSKGELTLKEANQLKRDFYSTLKSTNYGTSEVGAKIAAKKSAARGLREGIEANAKGQPVAELNKEMALAGRVRNAAERTDLMSQRNNLAGLIDTGLLSGTVGTGNPAFLGGILARRAMGSDFVKSKLAELLANLAS